MYREFLFMLVCSAPLNHFTGVQPFRSRQVLAVRVVNEKAVFTFNGIDDRFGQCPRNGRASPAAANSFVRPDEIFTYVISTVHYDCALQGSIIVAGVHSVQPKGIAVIPIVGNIGHIEAQTALQRTFSIGKSGSELITGIFTMSYQRIKKHCFILQVNYPQSFLS